MLKMIRHSRRNSEPLTSVGVIRMSLLRFSKAKFGVGFQAAVLVSTACELTLLRYHKYRDEIGGVPVYAIFEVEITGPRTA